ncbi:MAG: RagB/SusD family nutrient uptake outer membrane protein [Ferruginibacter sp.]|nr:RagB/SusD family nutrient uptake outer membrane protein [Chitinophagaceae bacterium]
MKKQIKYIIAIGLVLITNISCKKEYLTPVPPTTVSDVTAFDTPERILGNIRGLYSNTKAGAFYGGRYIVYGDIRGEDFLNETGNLVTGADVWSLNPAGTSTNSVVNLWAQAYYTINLCNFTIEGVTAKGPSVVGATLTANYLGEARLIRALCYYSLLQYYARPFADGAGSKPGLPLRITPIKGPGSSDLARSTVAQIYAQIIDDLNFAETNLPLTNATAELNTTRAHRNTAIALKTRVYLSMQNYPGVILEANKIVSPGNTPPFTATSGVPHALQPNIATVFSTFNTTESIMSFPMSLSSGDNPTTQNQLAFYFVRNLTNPGSAEYSLNPVGIIGDLVGWPNADARRGLTFFNVATNKRFVNKYPNGSPFLDYPPVIRYSEVLLNLAEALARTNAATADPRGLALLNAVRKRSDASVTIASTTQAQLIAAIMLERRIEFLGEGLRNNDLMRLLQTIPAKGSVPAKAPTDQGYIWPISATEMSLNKLMIDN